MGDLYINMINGENSHTYHKNEKCGNQVVLKEEVEIPAGFSPSEIMPYSGSIQNIYAPLSNIAEL